MPDNPKRGRGRPPVSPGGGVEYKILVTPEQRAKLAEIGPDRVRAWIDEHATAD